MTVPDEPEERRRFIADHLHTPVIGDILDEMGRHHQFLPPGLRRIVDGPPLVGRAMPVAVAEVFGPQRKPFGLLTEALDQLEPGDVYVAAGTRTPCAMWGEILSATAGQRRAAGAVLDGYHRDTAGVLTRGFAVFSRGPYAQDAGVRNTVTDYRVPVEIGGVEVVPGDLIVADIDGIVVVPKAIETEVLERAHNKVSAENKVLQAVDAGMSSTEAFTTFGVL